MSKTVWVDKQQCISCGICIANCPTVFRFDLRKKSEVYNPAGATASEIQRLAVDVCPVSCILWLE